jgi:hypothetical protein
MKIIKIFVCCVFLFFLVVMKPWHLAKEWIAWNRQQKTEKAMAAERNLYLNEIRHTFAEAMLKDLQLVPRGESGRTQEKIEEIGMDFTAHRRATIEEARALQVLVMEKFVQAVNAHEKIQPFLAVRPFSYKNISISIEFDNSTTVWCVYNIPDNAFAEENRNRLFYYKRDDFSGEMTNLHTEPYEDALKLVSSP